MRPHAAAFAHVLASLSPFPPPAPPFPTPARPSRPFWGPHDTWAAGHAQSIRQLRT